MKVLLAGSEALPFVKTGGLADVLGALPKELRRLGVDARVMIPLHKTVKTNYQNKLEFVADTKLKLGWREIYMGILKMEYSGVPCYFIDCEDFFGDEVYRGGDAENEQYLYFCRAVLTAIELTKFIPDVIHCNDWHTGMIPMLLKTQYSQSSLSKIKSVFTIHNIKFQGKMDFTLMKDMLDIPQSFYNPQGVEADGCANMMKTGIVYADKITTVSPTYAKEILTDWYGMGLDGVLRSREHDLCGIVNGIDAEEFDPLTDSALVKNYGPETMKDKWSNKKDLREYFSLGCNLYTPILSMVTRLTSQKGLDLVRHVLEELLQGDICFVLLGSGDKEFEDYFNYIAAKHPDKSGVHIGYNEELARRIYAGADFLLMPSRFEPCGLSQMIAQRYGTLPIVRETGGLIDTVLPWNEFSGVGDGFSFAAYNAHDMLNAIRYALSVFGNKASLRRLKKNAMLKDNSFLLSAGQYLELYKSLV